MATLTPIASIAASMLRESRPTTLVTSSIADPENTALFQTFANGKRSLQKELSEGTATTSVAAGTVEVSLLPWEPHWICTDAAANQ